MLSVKTGSRAPIDSNIYAKIFSKRPFLGEVIEKRGAQSLEDFTAENLKQLPQPSEERKNEFLAVVQGIVTERLGNEVGKAVSAQLNTYFGASSADHHGSINSSLAVSSNLMLAAGSAALKDPLLQFDVVLSCASVSLNNEDYPRGLMFHSSKGELQKLSLLPSNAHNCLVYNFRPYTVEEVTKLEGVLREKVREGTVTAAEAEKVGALLSGVYKRPEILSAAGVCEQFTQVNYHLWKQFFQGQGEVKDLIYIELEEVVRRLLVQVHCEQSTALHRFIFEADLEASVRQPLTVAMERYLRQGMLATHLFWGVSPKNYRLKLFLENGKLVSEDKTFTVPFTPEGVKQALQEKKLMPNLLTAYTLIHLYYGFNCLGGFNQMHYLDAMRVLYNESGLDTEPCQANSRLYHYGLETVFLNEQPALGTDLYLYGDENMWTDLLVGFSQVRLEEAFRASAPIVYGILEQDS